MKRKKEIVLGLLLVIGAVFILMNKTGFLQDIGLFTIIFTVILVGILIDNLVEKSIGGVLFSLAFLAILYDGPLGIEHLTPWPVLAAALLGTIGLDMIFKKKHVPVKYDETMKHWEHSEQVIDGTDEEVVECSVSFGSAVKYINSTRLKRAFLKSSFGNLSVYFDNAQLENGEAEVQVDVSLGNIELYIPAEWKVILDVNTSFGGVDEKGKHRTAIGDNVLSIKGNVSFGGMEIYYI